MEWLHSDSMVTEIDVASIDMYDVFGVTFHRPLHQRVLPFLSKH